MTGCTCMSWQHVSSVDMIICDTGRHSHSVKGSPSIAMINISYPDFYDFISVLHVISLYVFLHANLPVVCKFRGQPGAEQGPRSQKTFRTPQQLPQLGTSSQWQQTPTMMQINFCVPQNRPEHCGARVTTHVCLLSITGLNVIRADVVAAAFLLIPRSEHILENFFPVCKGKSDRPVLW